MHFLFHMNQDVLKKIGKLESFEIKNSSLVLCLTAPGLYIYSLLIFYFNKNATEISYMRELFAVLFLVVGLLPLTKKKKVTEYYGLYVFFCLFLFQHYLTYTVAINRFSIDYLLGNFIVMFGGILLLNNRLLIILFSTSQLLHMAYRVLSLNLDIITEGAVLISIVTIFIYSFIILNGIMHHRKSLQEVNKQLEEKIEQRTKDLETRAKELYEKNKDLEEFAYVVSHDLKRPLRNIHTLAEWLTSSEHIDTKCVQEDSEMGENLTKIKEQVEQMDLLINGILNYSLQKEKEQELKKIDVDFLARRIIMVNSSEQCLIELKNKLPVVLFNESQLLQVFQNLIQNAIKHNNKKYIHIKVGSEEKKEEYVFFISDNGPGIDDKYHEKIFQLFQKLEVNSHVDSIGIGLALVKKIIERSGGRVWLESKKGKGTTFYFTIRKD